MNTRLKLRCQKCKRVIEEREAITLKTRIHIKTLHCESHGELHFSDTEVA